MGCHAVALMVHPLSFFALLAYGLPFSCSDGLSVVFWFFLHMGCHAVALMVHPLSFLRFLPTGCHSVALMVCPLSFGSSCLWVATQLL